MKSFSRAHLKELDALVRMALARARQAGAGLPGQLPLFVDPANSTGFANDHNTGQNATNVPAGTGPIRTTAHLNAVMSVTVLIANTVITYLSDDASGTFLNPWTMVYPAGVSIAFVGTPQVLHTGGTLNAGTLAINPAAAGGGQHQTAHTTDIADWTPFISQFEINGFGTAPHPTYVFDTAGGNAGTSAWVMSDGGGDAPQTIATADLTRPVTPAQTAGTLTIGDSYEIRRGSVLAVAGAPGFLGSSLNPFLTSTPIVFFVDFAFTASSVGANGCSYFRCSFENDQGVGGIYAHCMFSGDIIELGQPASAMQLSAGGVYTFGTSLWTAPLQISGDTYFTGSFFLLGTAIGYANPLVIPGIGAGLCVNRNSGGTGIQVSGGGTFELGAEQTFGDTGALVWGRDNVRGMVIGAASTVVCSDAQPPTVTGGTSDFEFRGVGGLRTQVANTWDHSVDPPVVTTQRATTYANLVAAIGAGGFGGACADFVSEAHLILA